MQYNSFQMLPSLAELQPNTALHLHFGSCHGSCFRNNRAIS
jgi:hypothetical protein